MAYKNGKWEPNGFYGYVKPNMNVKTKYEINWTCSQDVVDRLDALKNNSLDNREYKVEEFDFLEDALELYIKLLYDDQCLWLRLYSQVIVDNEVVLEDQKMHIRYITDMLKPNRELEYRNNDLEKENQKLKSFLEKYNVNPNDVLEGKYDKEAM